ncbi:type II secretion system protein [Candidatus Roizmanbacteria bacterium]|nr:type II secretion system protein [Candidatus Roizmanbacteria bacterium]
MRKAFTLLEVMVSIGIVGLLIPAIFATVFVIVQQQLRIMALYEIKRQGDSISNYIQNQLKNEMRTIHLVPVGSTAIDTNNEVCNAVNTQSNVNYFGDKNGGNNVIGNKINYYIDGNKRLVSDLTFVGGVSTKSTILSSNRVEISGLSLSCERVTLFSQPVITVSFTVTYKTNSTKDRVSLVYQTRTQLRDKQ